MLSQSFHDGIHIGLRLAVFQFHIVDLIALLLEKAKQSLLFFLRIEILQLADHPCDQIAHLSQILGFHILQGCV